MLILCALVVMLSVQAGALDLLTPPIGANFPVGILPVPAPQLPREFPRPLSTPKVHPHSKPPKGTAGGSCATVAKYLLSEGRCHEYLNNTLPMHIEKMLSCEEFNLAGLVGTVLSTMTDSSGLLSILKDTLPLGMVGDVGLGGILSKGSSNEPPNHSPVSKVTKPLNGLLPLGQEAQGSHPASGARNPLKGLLSTVGLSKVVGGMAGKVDTLKDSTQGVLNGASEGVLGGATEGVLNSASQGVLNGATEGVLGGATEGVMNSASQGVLRGAAPGVLNGATQGVLHSATQGVLNGAVPGVLNGATQGVLNGATEGMLNGVVPPGVNDAIKGLLGNGVVEDLLDTLAVQKVTVESLKLTTKDDGILAHAQTTVSLGGKGLLGPVISILGFQVKGEVTLNIGIATNDTQCVTLQVQSKDIIANEVSLKIVKTVESSLPAPIPLPLPLDSLVSTLLTIEMNMASEESKSCDIDFSDFNKCKNSTGLFKYRVKGTKMSTDGLSIMYCADVVFKGKSSPVPGSRLPPDPKNANVSLTLAHTLIKEIVAHCARMRFETKAGLVVTITQIVYTFKSGKTIQVTYPFTVEKNGELIANGETAFAVLYEAKISEDKMNTRLTLSSPTHKVTLPEPAADVENAIAETLKIFWSCFSETIKQMNVPIGVTSNPLINGKVNAISKDLQAAN